MKKQIHKIIVIVGPNASGKSGLGVKIAKKVHGEIISADSRQIYKWLDIGSGKITKKEMLGIPHHCLGIANPKKVFTALDFKKCAQKAVLDIFSRGKTPIIVGGTGFYIDAALGRVKLGGVPPNLALRKKLEKKSAMELLTMLKKLDPKRAKTIEQKNPRRLIRANEIALAKKNERDGFFGKTLRRPTGRAEQFVSKRICVFSKRNPSSKIIWLGIKRPPEELKKRISARLSRRLPGIIREVKKLRQYGLSWKRLYDLGLEYRYVSLYLYRKISCLQLTHQLTSQIWHYAKRQMTWFKKNKKIHWIKNEKEAFGLKFL